MGIKLEVFIVTAIVLIVSTTYFFKIENSNSAPSSSTKQLEFKNTTLIEVNTEKMLSNIVCSHGVKKNEILDLKEIIYHSKSINSLVAESGEYKNGIMYLDGGIKLQQKEGYVYHAEHAIYNTEKETLNIASEFTMYINKNTIRGRDLIYDAKTKVAKSKNINATVYTTEK